MGNGSLLPVPCLGWIRFNLELQIYCTGIVLIGRFHRRGHRETYINNIPRRLIFLYPGFYDLNSECRINIS